MFEGKCFFEPRRDLKSLHDRPCRIIISQLFGVDELHITVESEREDMLVGEVVYGLAATLRSQPVSDLDCAHVVLVRITLEFNHSRIGSLSFGPPEPFFHAG